MKPLAILLLCGFLGGSAAAQLSPTFGGNDTPALRLPLDRPFGADLRLAQQTEEETQPKIKPDIYYVPTPQRLVDLMLLMAEVKKGDLLYDLGSGDGRLVITAAKTFGARGIGIEIDPALIAEAKKNAAAAGVEDKVEFRQQDLFKSNFQDATVITLYLLDELNRRLRPQLFAQVKPGTRIVSHAFRMGEWEPDAERTLKIKGTSYDAYFWVVPANMSGRWKISGDRSSKGIPEAVVVEQTFQNVSLRAGDGGEEIGRGSVSGNNFVLTVNQPAGGKPLSFTGTIEGNSIKATPSAGGQSWRGERESGTERPLDAGVSPAL